MQISTKALVLTALALVMIAYFLGRSGSSDPIHQRKNMKRDAEKFSHVTEQQITERLTVLNQQVMEIHKQLEQLQPLLEANHELDNARSMDQAIGGKRRVDTDVDSKTNEFSSSDNATVEMMIDERMHYITDEVRQLRNELAALRGKLVENNHSPANDTDVTYLPGLAGQYYKGKDFNTRSLSRVDFEIRYGGSDSDNPFPKELGEAFSVKWTGYLYVEEKGEYKLSTVSDDGIQVWLNDTVIIDNWTDHGPTKDQSSIILDTGYYPLIVKYYEQGGGHVCELKWSRPGESEQFLDQRNLFHVYDDEYN